MAAVLRQELNPRLTRDLIWCSRRLSEQTAPTVGIPRKRNFCNEWQRKKNSLGAKHTSSSRKLLSAQAVRQHSVCGCILSRHPCVKVAALTVLSRYCSEVTRSVSLQRSPLRPASPSDVPAAASREKPATPRPRQPLPHRRDPRLAAGLRQGSRQVRFSFIPSHRA